MDLKKTKWGDSVTVHEQKVTLCSKVLVHIANSRINLPRHVFDEFSSYVRDICLRIKESSLPDDGNKYDLFFDFSQEIKGGNSAPRTHVPAEIRIEAFKTARIVWDTAIRTAAKRKIYSQTNTKWIIKESENWINCQPEGYALPRQGWKIHVSATPYSSPIILERCLQVLVEEVVAFKHAATLDYIEALTSAKCYRGHAGKFITVYPVTTRSAQRIARKLHNITKYYDGQQILSDKQYRNKSLIHYRYGVFYASPILNNDGIYEIPLLSPDGTYLKDNREAYSEPPAWAPPILDDHIGHTKPQKSKIGTRYIVSGSIRQANRGGIYRALDTETKKNVIIKQARPYTSSELLGQDSITILKNEKKALIALGKLSAKYIDSFFVDGNFFLVQSAIPGSTLQKIISEKINAPDITQSTDIKHLLLSICDLLREIHLKGYVCRDFNPNNIIIDDNAQVKLIDLELLAAPGTFVYKYYTYGFAAPELINSQKWFECPSYASDLYSLGATIFNVITRSLPPIYLQATSPAHLNFLWELAINRLKGTGFSPLSEIIKKLTSYHPSDRGSIDEVVKAIISYSISRFSEKSDSVFADKHTERKCLSMIDEAIENGTQLIIDGKNESDSARLWKSSTFGESTDECNVQHGASGILGYLCDLSKYSDQEALKKTVYEASEWIEGRISKRTKLLPGLYFGVSGPIWSCIKASKFLGNNEPKSNLIDILFRMPNSWPNPDICHGLAGFGLTLCYIWLSYRDKEILEKIISCAEHLVKTKIRDKYGIYWKVSDDFNSSLKGISHYGFAHGIAGIGYFLMIAGIITKREDFINEARSAGNALVLSAEREAHGAKWRSSVDKSGTNGSDVYYYWCNGSSGIGSFLIRLWLLTHEEKYKTCAEEAACMVHHSRWIAGTSVCHGLSGNGEFLLDMFNISNDPKYLSMAYDLAEDLFCFTTEVNDKKAFVDESGVDLTFDYNTGLAGVLSFLDRLRSKRNRPWMLDELMPLKYESF